MNEIDKWLGIVDAAVQHCDRTDLEDADNFVNNDGQMSPMSLTGTINEEASSYTVTMNRDELAQLQQADFDHPFEVDGDQVTFLTNDPRALVGDLEMTVDAGETSWAEVMGIDTSVDVEFDDSEADVDFVDTSDMGDEVVGDAGEDVSDLIAQIDMAQSSGMSMSNVKYPIERLYDMPADRIKSIYSKVIGEAEDEHDDELIQEINDIAISAAEEEIDEELEGKSEDGIQYRDPEGRYIITYTHSKGYQAHGKGEFAKCVKRDGCDELDDCIEKAEICIEDHMDSKLTEEEYDTIRDELASQGYSREQIRRMMASGYGMNRQSSNKTSNYKSKPVYQVLKDGEPFKIRGELVKVTGEQAARKTLATLANKPFNKGKKFTARIVESTINESVNKNLSEAEVSFKAGDNVEICDTLGGGTGKIKEIVGNYAIVEGEVYPCDRIKKVVDENFPKTVADMADTHYTTYEDLINDYDIKSMDDVFNLIDNNEAFYDELSDAVLDDIGREPSDMEEVMVDALRSELQRLGKIEESATITTGMSGIIDHYFPQRPDEGRYGTGKIPELVRDLEDAGFESTAVGGGETEYYHPDSHCVIHVHRNFGEDDRNYAWCEEPDAEPPVKGEPNPMETTTAGGIATGPAPTNIKENNKMNDFRRMINLVESYETDISENDVEEGNEFSGALAKANASSADSFEVDGKEYPVTENLQQEAELEYNPYENKIFGDALIFAQDQDGGDHEATVEFTYDIESDTATILPSMKAFIDRLSEDNLFIDENDLVDQIEDSVRNFAKENDIQVVAYEDVDQETMRGRQAWEQGDTEESHTVNWDEVTKAVNDAAETIFGSADTDKVTGIVNDTKNDVDDSANTQDAVQIAVNKMRQNENVTEEHGDDEDDLYFDYGETNNHEKTSDGDSTGEDWDDNELSYDYNESVVEKANDTPKNMYSALISMIVDDAYSEYEQQELRQFMKMLPRSVQADQDPTQALRMAQDNLTSNMWQELFDMFGVDELDEADVYNSDDDGLEKRLNRTPDELDPWASQNQDDRTPEFRANQARAKELYSQTAGDEYSVKLVARKMGKSEAEVRELLDETMDLEEDNYIDYVKKMLGTQ